jgi:hypothetical protein
MLSKGKIHVSFVLFRAVAVHVWVTSVIAMKILAMFSGAAFEKFTVDCVVH